MLSLGARLKRKTNPFVEESGWYWLCKHQMSVSVSFCLCFYFCLCVSLLSLCLSVSFCICLSPLSAEAPKIWGHTCCVSCSWLFKTHLFPWPGLFESQPYTKALSPGISLQSFCLLLWCSEIMTSSVSWRIGVGVGPPETDWCMVKPSLTAVQRSGRIDFAQGVHRGLMEVMRKSFRSIHL